MKVPTNSNPLPVVASVPPETVVPLSKPTSAIPEATILPPLLLTKPLIYRVAVLSAPADAAIKPLLLMVSAKISQRRRSARSPPPEWFWHW